MDIVDLSRLQFAFTAAYHYLFVPLSIGVGLIMAIFQTKAHKTKSPKDIAFAQFWVRLFTVTFAVGVATGITMEFSFGTNWANYSRFVGDIFGAPLAGVFPGKYVLGRGHLWSRSRERYVLPGELMARMVWQLPFRTVDHHCQQLDADACRLRAFF